jgi:hypothetical protein
MPDIMLGSRRNHHAGDRAKGRGNSPAQRQHQIDAHADEPARYRVMCGGAHRQTKAGKAKEDKEHG